MTVKYYLYILPLCFSLSFLKAQNPIVQNLLNDVRIDSLKNFVRQLSGEKQVKINGQIDTIKTRFHQDPGNEKAFQFMKSEFVRYGYQVDSMTFGTLGKNLFAIKPGYREPNKRFMLGAHYDNLPPLAVAPGADDNASGSSTVLEAARVFRNYSFPFTIVFALWDEEEAGLLGSIAYAPTIGSDNEILLGYINVDMLGWDGNNDSIADLHVRPVANSLFFSQRAQACNSIYNIGLGLHIINPGSWNTDHASFWNNNQTAIGIDEEYDNDFNPNWHTLADSLGQFNLPFYLKCSKLVYATLADCALDTVNTVGISELSADLNAQINPNPFTSIINVRTDQAASGFMRIVIKDSFGRVVYEQTYYEQSFQIQLQGLPDGLYFIQTSTKTSHSIQKLIKQSP